MSGTGCSTCTGRSTGGGGILSSVGRSIKTSQTHEASCGTVTVSRGEGGSYTPTLNVPAQAVAGESFQIDGAVCCSGGGCPAGESRLFVNGSEVASQSLDLSDGECHSSTFTVQYTPQSAGDLTVELVTPNNSVARSVVVADPQSGTYQPSLSVPSSANVGEPFSIDGEVCCSGGNCPPGDVTLTVGGNTLAAPSVDYAEGSCDSTTFSTTHTPQSPGDLEVVLETPHDTVRRIVSVNDPDPGPGEEPGLIEGFVSFVDENLLESLGAVLLLALYLGLQ